MQFLVILVSSEGTSAMYQRNTLEAAEAKYQELYERETAVESDDTPVYLCLYKLNEGADGFDVEMDTNENSGVSVLNGTELKDFQFGMDMEDSEDEEEEDEE